MAKKKVKSVTRTVTLAEAAKQLDVSQVEIRRRCKDKGIDLAGRSPKHITTGELKTISSP